MHQFAAIGHLAKHVVLVGDEERPTTLFGSVVRNAKMSFVVSPSFSFRTEVQLVQMPAKKAKGRDSSKANRTV